MTLAATFTCAFVVALALVWVLASIDMRGVGLDRPNARSLHPKPIPRIGGAGLLGGAILAWMPFGQAHYWQLWLAAASLAVLSIFDDLYDNIGVRFRFLSQGAVVLAFLLAGYTGPSLLFILALLSIWWMANLYNFMDGSDGLAGGMAVLGFGTYGALALLASNEPLAVSAFSIAGAALGFLVWNFHPARIFMGDVGSVPLGFIAGAVGMIGWQEGAWPFWVPPIIFLPFIVDASVTLIRRYLRGERLEQGHRSHYYQRLLMSGLGHRKTALWGYGLMAAGCLLALFLDGAAGIEVFLILIVWAGIYAAILSKIDRLWRAHLDLKNTP